jgi:regulator of replication initiation timing
MAEPEIQLKRIQTKLQQLLKEHHALQKENNHLKEELDDVKKQFAIQHENMDSLKQQVNVLKYTGGELNEADKKEFEKKINSYLREIDRCITMLSQ